MTNEQIVRELLEKYLSQIKAFHLIILTIFLIAQAIFAYFVFKKMEKFKAFLKKSEIKFSRYHELQIETLRINYQKLVYFNVANTALFESNYNSNSHNRYKQRINQWIKSFNDCITQLTLDKILLPQDLIVLIDITIKEFKKVSNILQKEKEHLEYTEMENNGNLEYMYNYDEDELAVINTLIEKLKSEDFVQKANQNIRSLRISIEKHFSAMNG